MERCEKRHEEIIFDSRSCPLCEAQEIEKGMAQEIKDLKEEISRLEDDL